MHAYEAIARRTSVRSYRQEPVPRYVIERLIAAAVRAPNHKLTEPWRFVVVTGEAKRRYAEIRRAHRAKRFENPESPEAKRAIEKTVKECLETPAFIFVLCKVTDDPVRQEEDYASVMMGIQNLMVAATADGLGTYLRTGGIMSLPEVRELVGAGDEFRIVGIVSLGYLAAEPEPTRRTTAAEFTRWME